jgi:hypothetical protein
MNARRHSAGAQCLFASGLAADDQRAIDLMDDL